MENTYMCLNVWKNDFFCLFSLEHSLFTTPLSDFFGLDLDAIIYLNFAYEMFTVNNLIIFP